MSVIMQALASWLANGWLIALTFCHLHMAWCVGALVVLIVAFIVLTVAEYRGKV